MKFYIKDFFSNYGQIRRKLRIWSHLLKKSLIENFIVLYSETSTISSCPFPKTRVCVLDVFKKEWV